MDQPASQRIEELIRERVRLDLELERSQRLLAILFVDIVGSTRFYDEQGNTAGLVMVQKCLDLLIPVIEQFGGHVVKTVGDAILARFDNPETAVRCAVQMERSLAQRNSNRAPVDQIHIHIGINFGLALLKDNDVFGDVVNVTARIEGAAESDQIVISPSVYEQVRHILDIRVRKKASGVNLRGKAGKLELYEVLWLPDEPTGPTPPPPSRDQLVMATGLHPGPLMTDQRSVSVPTQAEPAPLHRGLAGLERTQPLGAIEAEKRPEAGVRFTLALVCADGSLREHYVLDHPGMASAARATLVCQMTRCWPLSTPGSRNWAAGSMWRTWAALRAFFSDCASRAACGTATSSSWGARSCALLLTPGASSQ